MLIQSMGEEDETAGTLWAFVIVNDLISKVVALICRKDDQQQLYVANCGDSRAVMISGAGAVAMCGHIDPVISFWYQEE